MMNKRRERCSDAKEMLCLWTMTDDLHTIMQLAWRKEVG